VTGRKPKEKNQSKKSPIANLAIGDFLILTYLCQQAG
jgi:hypothetical protein